MPEEAAASVEEVVIDDSYLEAIKKKTGAEETPPPAKPDEGKGEESPPAKPDGEKPEESSTEAEGEPEATVEIDGVEYPVSEVQGWKKDSDQKKSWQKKNTESAMEMADQRKMIEPIVQFVNKLREKGELISDIKDMAVAEFGEEFGEVIDKAMKFDSETFKHPDSEELATYKEQEEEQKFIKEMKTEFGEKHNLEPEAVNEVYEFADKHYQDTGEALSLESAMKLMKTEQTETENAQLKEKLKKAKKNLPKAPNTLPKDRRGLTEIDTKPADRVEDIDNASIIQEYGPLYTKD
jgi:hypothetical protein